MKTKAAILYELNKPLVVRKIEIPKLKKGQVLVKIQATGICRSQINEWHGFKGADRFLPHLLGHEAAGIVVETGTSVEKVHQGDHVVVSWIKGAGIDAPSAQYLYGNKIINSGAIATFTQYAVISENRLTPIPNNIPVEIAALLGCAFPTGAGIINNTLKMKKRATIAIFGVGGVGSSAILSAKGKDCKKIIAVDISYEKLKFAKRIGATDVINVTNENAVTKIKKICSGGAEYAIEASGNKKAMEDAFESLSDLGTLVIAGNLKLNEKISINPFDLINGKKIFGSWGGETNPDRDIPLYAKDYLSGKIDLKILIDKVMPLTEINRAFDLLEKGRSYGRIIIHPNYKR